MLVENSYIVIHPSLSSSSILKNVSWFNALISSYLWRSLNILLTLTSGKVSTGNNPLVPSVLVLLSAW